jgi:hypothetical protein
VQVFRYKRSIEVTYDRQGYIYFISRAYRDLPAWQQERIRELCGKCGGEYGNALLEFVTTDAGATAVCMRHNLSQSTLERVVKKYYEAFPKRL